MLRSLRLASLAALALSAVACTNAPRSEVATAAIARFSQEDFCPRARVSAKLQIRRETPPAAIASDPERLAMWDEASRRAGEDEARKTLLVSGCGEQRTFACWEFPGTVPRSARTGRALRPRSIGWSCNEVAGSAAPAEALVHP